MLRFLPWVVGQSCGALKTTKSVTFLIMTRDITISSVFPNKDKVRLFLGKKLYGSVQNQISLYLAVG